MGISLRHTSGTTIENSNIKRPQHRRQPPDGRHQGHLRRRHRHHRRKHNITKTSTDVQIYAGTIENNYMAQHGMTTGDHINGVTTNGDDQPLLIQHNPSRTTSSRPTPSAVPGLLPRLQRHITTTSLAGGATTIYGGTGADGPTSNIVVTNNTISTMY